MTLRPLGRSALQVSPLCFGGNVFGWTADERTSFSLLDAWIDAGFNFVDTADVYSRWAPGHSGGESETVIGRWIRQGGRRDKLVIATKVGLDMGEGRVGLKPARIRAAVEDSLRRLNVDCIDLYQAHRDDPDTPLEETLEAFAALVKEGKVRAIGASNYSAARLQEALAASRRLGLPRFESLQPLYNLYDRAEFEQELQPLCRREEIGVISYYALAAGFLSGKYTRAGAAEDAGRRTKFNFPPIPVEKTYDVIDVLQQVAARRSATVAQVALAWLLHQPAVTSVIIGARKSSQLQDNLGAVDLKLEAEDLKQLGEVSRLAPEYPGWMLDTQGGDRWPGQVRDWSKYAGPTK